jgi:hypothetical protein
MKPDYFRTEKINYVLERSRTTGNYYIRQKGTMNIWTLEAFAMAQANALALIETLTEEDVENMAAEMADKVKRRSSNRDSLTEDGKPYEMTDEEKSDQYWQSNTR